MEDKVGTIPGGRQWANKCAAGEGEDKLNGHAGAAPQCAENLDSISAPQKTAGRGIRGFESGIRKRSSAYDAMENKDVREQLTDSSEGVACQNSISRRIKRLPLPSQGQESATTAANLASTDIDPTCTRSQTPQLPLQTPDDIVKGDLPEESKRQAVMMTQQQRGPERNAADSVLDKAQTGGVSSATFRTPRDEADQRSWLRLEYDELSMDGSKHPDYKDGGSSLSSQDLDLEHHRGQSNELYGTYISGMRSLAQREAERREMEGLSDLMASLDSNIVVPHDRTSSKVYDSDGHNNTAVCRETVHPIDNRPAPERTRRRMSMLPLLRRQTTRGAVGGASPSDISSTSSTRAIADVGVRESLSNRPRAGEPTRRSSVRHLGGILGGLLRKKPNKSARFIRRSDGECNARRLALVYLPRQLEGVATVRFLSSMTTWAATAAARAVSFLLEAMARTSVLGRPARATHRGLGHREEGSSNIQGLGIHYMRPVARKVSDEKMYYEVSSQKYGMKYAYEGLRAVFLVFQLCDTQGSRRLFFFFRPPLMRDSGQSPAKAPRIA
ncbi:hypothetical protein THAOC_10483 [Thalassiosira oceanica]|uniref:Uncharacterized protein n=1 Tax=Thalassiosira oceanica TaxID=159749 RepID=K0SSG2_THAOC|nr:hypothetical protein THAOC_10483 [Thalassiosira oceanica]|eukprot:EJK68345.1 hypothetical protein THAOC_10483 [Thalassiosira oceanica]